MTNKLIGSHKSLEDLKKLIKDRWYWNEVNFHATIDGTWLVSSGKGLIDGLIVIFKKGRYRLERTEVKS